MNDVKSLLIATTVLAIGGLGLYMYKSEEDNFDDQNDEDYNSDTASETSSQNSYSSDLEEIDIDDYKEEKISKKNGGTKRNNKKNGGTRKKY